MNLSSEKWSVPLPAKLRWVLMAAFGGLLALMLVAGRHALDLLSEMHVKEEQARRAFAQRTQTLSSLCVSIQTYSETVQLYVLSSSPAAGDTRDQLRRLSAQIHSDFGSFTGERGQEPPAEARSIGRPGGGDAAERRAADGGAGRRP